MNQFTLAAKYDYKRVSEMFNQKGKVFSGPSPNSNLDIIRRAPKGL